MAFSELEQDIRDLCSKAVTTKKPEQLETICAELRAALQEHMRQTRALAAETLRGIDRARSPDKHGHRTPKTKAGK
jgi:hypothetical protein